MEPRDLSAHESYEAGRGIEEVARELGRDPAEFVKLASNENPHGPSPAAAEAVAATADGVHVYPTAAHVDLRSAIADRWGVDTAQVWLSPGADGAIDYLGRAILRPGESVLVPDPGFAYYPMSARYHHGTVDTYGLSGPDFEQTPETVLDAYDGHRIVYLTSPHNPTGATFSPAQVRAIAERTNEETLVVVDEAYAEYADWPSVAPAVGGREGIVDLPGREADLDAWRQRDDVAVLRTFSKAYGLAGLRVGYALVPREWADAYSRVNTPFAVNEVACRAALAALDDADHVRRTVESAREARKRMASEIDAPVRESQANFVLVEVDDATAVAEATKRRGVIVRDCTSFGLPEHVRISCGTDAETERAIEAVNAVLTEVRG